ncbi:hypothetical protein SAMN05216388_10069 [Halorientalis persicus]|uniref:Uncharacterized protein n=1 Tax=Halorientalis persicus TaxID=1367881 RepID=A0A1H8KBC2_9EURY|nr:hypothetical protein [Halorientalis persicus]SEN90319.1 hypothetical protein SAMN05216388_10069 [Halorientalis persicus]
MFEPVFAHAGSSALPLPHAVVDSLLGIGAGLVVVALFYLVLRFYAGSSESEF